ncbi:MAG: hypothetical protein IT258_08955 [Saprospiraceae bacterium]|nr:hypothetical protein [Saprospiraceae bacterium]
MKNILGARLKRLLDGAKPGDLDHLLNAVNGRLDDVQKDVMLHRKALWGLCGLFLLFIFNIVGLKELSLVGGTEIKTPLGLQSVDELAVCGVAVLSFYNYFMLVTSLLYRSQLRYMHTQLYERLYPNIFKQSLHQYTMPPSPGHILKTMNKITSIKHGEEAKDSFVKKIRWIAIYFERGLQWVFLIGTCVYIMKNYWSQNPWLILAILVVCSASATYVVLLSSRYNNYLGLYKTDFEKFIKSQDAH